MAFVGGYCVDCKAMFPLVLSAALAGPDEARIQEIINDTKLPHVAIPRGTLPGFDWREKPRLGMANNPGEFKAFITWGQVYEPEGGSPSTNTRYQIRNVQGFILSKKTGKWTQVQHTLEPGGAAYREDFKDDVSVPPDVRQESTGSISVKGKVGFNYHFWPTSGRVAIDSSDSAGVYTVVQARLVLDDPKQADDRDKAKFMMSMGGDYWKALDSQWDNFKTNGDAMIGRFRWIGKEWGWFHACTMTEAEIRKYPPPAPKELAVIR